MFPWIIILLTGVQNIHVDNRTIKFLIFEFTVKGNLFFSLKRIVQKILSHQRYFLWCLHHRRSFVSPSSNNFPRQDMYNTRVFTSSTRPSASRLLVVSCRSEPLQFMRTNLPNRLPKIAWGLKRHCWGLRALDRSASYSTTGAQRNIPQFSNPYESSSCCWTRNYTKLHNI